MADGEDEFDLLVVVVVGSCGTEGDGDELLSREHFVETDEDSEGSPVSMQVVEGVVGKGMRSRLSSVFTDDESSSERPSVS